VKTGAAVTRGAYSWRSSGGRLRPRRTVASAGHGRTTVWDLPRGRRRHRFDADFARRRENRYPKADGACRAVAFSPDGKLVADGDGENPAPRPSATPSRDAPCKADSPSDFEVPRERH